MKTSIPILLSALMISAQAGNSGDFSKQSIEYSPKKESRWSFGIGASALTGADVNFSGLGTWVSPNQVPLLTTGIDRTYDDGFNRVDGTGNGGGQTWNWGYDNPSQAGPGSATMSIYRGLANGSSTSDSDDFHGGVEVFGYYDMGPVNGLGNGARWGIKGGFSWHSVDLDDNRTVATGFASVNDTFQFNGVSLPSAPYSGSFAGPGPLLGDSPSRSISPNMPGGTASGIRDFSSDLFSLDVGPYIDFPLSPRFSLRLEGGGTLVIARGKYSNTTTTSFPGIASQTSSVSGRETEVLPGIFVGANAIFNLDSQWSIYSGLRYHLLEDFDVRAGSSVATLDMDGGVMINLGVIYRF